MPSDTFGSLDFFLWEEESRGSPWGVESGSHNWTGLCSSLELEGFPPSPQLTSFYTGLLILVSLLGEYNRKGVVHFLVTDHKKIRPNFLKIDTFPIVFLQSFQVWKEWNICCNINLLHGYSCKFFKNLKCFVKELIFLWSMHLKSIWNVIAGKKGFKENNAYATLLRLSAD